MKKLKAGNEAKVDEGGASNITHKTVLYNNIFPAYYDIPITLDFNSNTRWPDVPLKLNFKKWLSFNTCGLAAFSTGGSGRNNEQTAPIISNLLAKLDMMEWSIRFTHASTDLKIMSMEKVNEKVMNQTTYYETQPCNYPIIVATNKIPEARYFWRGTSANNLGLLDEQNLEWGDINEMSNNHHLQTYHVGDIVKLHDQKYPEQWHRLSDSKLHKDLKPVPNNPIDVNNTVAAILGHWVTPRGAMEFTVPINNRLAVESQHHRCTLRAKTKNPDIDSYLDNPDDCLIADRSMQFMESNFGHSYKRIYVAPTLQRGDENTLQPGYVILQLKRSVSFVLRMWNASNVSCDQGFNRRLLNWRLSHHGTTFEEVKQLVNSTFAADGTQVQASQGISFVPNVWSNK